MEGVGGSIYQLHLEIPMRRPLRARPEICKIVIVYLYVTPKSVNLLIMLKSKLRNKASIRTNMAYEMVSTIPLWMETLVPC